MNEVARRYRKEMQKRVIVNLKKEDYERWCAYASLKAVPVATMIRSAVEKEISEIEDSYETGIEDLITFQNDLKKG